jgi:hypothetical protein
MVVVPPSAPSPEATAAVTGTPLRSTSSPSGSLICTEGCRSNEAPTLTEADGWSRNCSRSAFAGGSVADAVKRTSSAPGACSLTNRTTTLWVPLAPPSTHRAPALPSGPVKASSGVTMASGTSSASTKTTRSPATGLPSLSVTSTTIESGSGVPAVPSCAVPLTALIAAGAPGSAGIAGCTGNERSSPPQPPETRRVARVIAKTPCLPAERCTAKPSKELTPRAGGTLARGGLGRYEVDHRRGAAAWRTPG